MVVFTVAIDGPAAAGKGTIGRLVAREFGFAHMDTGLLYRAVAKKLIESDRLCDAEAAQQAASALRSADLIQNGLRSPEVSRESSRIAAMPPVRTALLEVQRRFARREGGAVLDGRDIATVIAPNAEVKLFVTASLSVRAERRCREIEKTGTVVDCDEVLDDLQKRDQRDVERGLAALQQSPDALLIDTTNLSIKQAAAIAIAAVGERYGTDLA